MASKELIASVIEAIVKNPPKVTRFKDMETLEFSETVDHTPTAQAAAISTILAALQEPTEVALESGYAWDEHVTATETHPRNRGLWRAMLNASALGEQSE